MTSHEFAECLSVCFYTALVFSLGLVDLVPGGTGMGRRLRFVILLLCPFTIPWAMPSISSTPILMASASSFLVTDTNCGSSAKESRPPSLSAWGFMDNIMWQSFLRRYGMNVKYMAWCIYLLNEFVGGWWSFFCCCLVLWWPVWGVIGELRESDTRGVREEYQVDTVLCLAQKMWHLSTPVWYRSSRWNLTAVCHQHLRPRPHTTWSLLLVAQKIMSFIQ